MTQAPLRVGAKQSHIFKICVFCYAQIQSYIKIGKLMT
jgi:hypothetical protein